MVELRAQTVVWDAIGASVRGYNHRRRGLANEDFLHWAETVQPDPAIVLAVADGHGSASSFRAEIGSRIAATFGVAMVRTFLATIGNGESIESIAARAQSRLPETLARGWRQLVEQHVSKRPFSEDEVKQVDASAGRAGSLWNIDPVLRCYGTTLMVAAVTGRLMLLAKIGDGEVVVTSAQGRTTRLLPADGFLAEETTSLCLPSAEQYVQVAVGEHQADGHEAVVLLVLASDGYSNSFVDDESFIKVSPDVLHLLKEHGAVWVREHLPQWLDQASKEGSGDDATLGLIYRCDMVR